MPRPFYAVVIVDAQLAHTRERERNLAAIVAQLLTRPDLTDADRRYIADRLRVEYDRQHLLRADGSLHSNPMPLDCPLGRPNCRNCGDPSFADSCARDGHCPLCGTAHGVASDATLAANGYALLLIDEFPDPDDLPPGAPDFLADHEWDLTARRFIRRKVRKPKSLTAAEQQQLVSAALTGDRDHVLALLEALRSPRVGR